MRAIVVPGNSHLSRKRQAASEALSPLVDRPFVQHVVEYVLDRGVQEIDFVLPAEDRATKELLGDGTRWGAQFRFHARAGQAYATFKKIAVGTADERLLLVQSDRLPFLPPDLRVYGPTLFCSKESELSWTGWGILHTNDLRHLPKGIKKNDLFHFLAGARRYPVCTESVTPLTADSYEGLIEANRRVLTGEFPGLLMSGREVRPGIWMARHVSVHATARLTAPVYLGENCRLAALVHAGPGTTIGRDCVIDRETVVSDSVICGGSYVGQKLALRGVVVDRSHLANTRWDAEIEGVDDLLLGSVSSGGWRAGLAGALGRVAAGAIFVAALPLIFLIFLGSLLGLIPALRREFMLRTPAVSDTYRWKSFPVWSFGGQQVPAGNTGWLRHFFFCFLPALVSLAFGYLDLAGSRPRTIDQAKRTAPGQLAFLRTRSGVLQPGLWQNAEPANRASEVSGREAAGVLLNYGHLILQNCFSGVLPLRERRHAE